MSNDALRQRKKERDGGEKIVRINVLDMRRESKMKAQERRSEENRA